MVEECNRKKRQLKEIYKKWRRGNDEKETYRKRRKEFKKLCKEKEEKRLEKLEEEVRNTKTEEEIWKIINRERKERADIEEEISMEEWETLVNCWKEARKKGESRWREEERKIKSWSYRTKKQIKKGTDEESEKKKGSRYRWNCRRGMDV